MTATALALAVACTCAALAGLAAGAVFGGRRVYSALSGGDVESLRAANRELMAQMAKEADRTLRQMGELRAQTVWGFHAEGKPSFAQGDAPLSELHELVTARACQQYVDKIEELLKTVGSLNVQVAALARALQAAEDAAPKPRRRPKPPGTGSVVPSSES